MMNKNTRQPVRTQFSVQGDQLLQKRTRSHKKGPQDKLDKSLLFGHDNLPKKQRQDTVSQSQQELDTHQQESEDYGSIHADQYLEQKKMNAHFAATINPYQNLMQSRQLQKTNPRVAASKGTLSMSSNQRNSKQIMKQNAKNFQQMNAGNIGQYPQYPGMPAQMQMGDFNGMHPHMQNPQMNQMMMGMAHMAPMHQMMPQYSMPYQVGMPTAQGFAAPGQQFQAAEQIGELQKQIAFLSQMTQMQGQVSMLQNKAQAQANVYQNQFAEISNSNLSENQIELSEDVSEIKTNKQIPAKTQQSKNLKLDELKQIQLTNKRASPMKKVAIVNMVPQVSPMKEKKSSYQKKVVRAQKTKQEEEINQSQNISPEAKITTRQTRNKIQKVEVIDPVHLPVTKAVTNSKKTSAQPIKEKSPIQVKDQVTEKSLKTQKTQPKVEQEFNLPNLRRSNRLVNNDVKYDHSESTSKFDSPPKNALAQKNKTRGSNKKNYDGFNHSPESQVLTPAKNTRASLRQAQAQVQQYTDLVKSHSPATQHHEASQTPIPEQQIIQETIGNSVIGGSKLLQTLKNDLRKQEQQRAQEMRKKREKPFGSSNQNQNEITQQNFVNQTNIVQEVQYKALKKTPTKDEFALFGEDIIQKEVEDANKKIAAQEAEQREQENPLIQNRQKFEAQTEIVIQKDDNKIIDEQSHIMCGVSEQQRNYDEEQEEEQQLAEEEIQILDERKAQDMDMLFGVSQTEKSTLLVNVPVHQTQSEVKQEIYSQSQKNEDSQLLFGNAENYDVIEQSWLCNDKSQTKEVKYEDEEEVSETQQMNEVDMTEEDIQQEQVDVTEQSVEEEEEEDEEQGEFIKQKLELERQIAEIKRQIEKSNNEKSLNLVNEKVSIVADEIESEIDNVEADEQMVDEETQNDNQFNTTSHELQRHENISLHSIMNNTQVEYSLSSNDIPKELALPKYHNKLYDLIKQIDLNLNYMYMRHQTPIFSTLKQMVKQSANQDFNLKHLKQILYLCPQLLNHSWEKKFGSIELIISVPSNIEKVLDQQDPVSQAPFDGILTSQLISKRQEALKEQLILKAVQQFESAQRMYKEFQHHKILKYKKWPTNFDFDTMCDEIELYELKPQPQQQQKQGINEFIESFDTKSRARKTIEEQTLNEAKLQEEKNQQMVNQESQKNQEENDQSDDNSSQDSSEQEERNLQKKQKQFQSNTGISDETMKAIQMKQKIDIEARNMNDEVLEKQEIQKNIERLHKLSEQLRAVFLNISGSQLFMPNLLKQLSEGQRGNFTSQRDIQDHIKQLSVIFPKWLTIRQHDQGTLVKLHKHLNLQGYDIKKQIQFYYLRGNTLQNQDQQHRFSKSLPPPSLNKSQNHDNDVQTMSAQSKESKQQLSNEKLSKVSSSNQNQVNSAFKPFQRKSQSIPPINTYNQQQRSQLDEVTQKKQQAQNSQQQNLCNQSSSGTFLSGNQQSAQNSAPSNKGVETIDQPYNFQPSQYSLNRNENSTRNQTKHEVLQESHNHNPSKFISPLKDQQMLKQISPNQFQSQNIGQQSGFKDIQNSEEQSSMQFSTNFNNMFANQNQFNNEQAGHFGNERNQSNGGMINSMANMGMQLGTNILQGIGNFASGFQANEKYEKSNTSNEVFNMNNQQQNSMLYLDRGNNFNQLGQKSEGEHMQFSGAQGNYYNR